MVGTVIVIQGEVVRPSQLIACVRRTYSEPDRISWVAVGKEDLCCIPSAVGKRWLQSWAQSSSRLPFAPRLALRIQFAR